MSSSILACKSSCSADSITNPAKIKILFLGYGDSDRLANLYTASTAQALIGLIWKSSAVLKLKNVYRTNLYTFLISYTYIRINYDFKHNLSLSWT
jgi:hypothetical protein